MQPGFGDGPIPLYRFGRDLQRFSGFLNGKAAKESQLDNFRLARILLSELMQRRVDAHKFSGLFRREYQGFVEGHNLVFAATLSAQMAAGMVNQDAAHDLGRDGKKVRATSPINGVMLDELEIRLMDQSGGLKGVILPFATHVPPGKTPHFVVDQGDQLRGGILVSIGEVSQEAGHFAG